MQTGKIFPDSENVFQDQARILFDYYRQAAEKIVAQEEDIEARISDLENHRKELEASYETCWKWLLTIIFFWKYWTRRKEITAEIEETDAELAKQRQAYNDIFRGYKVNKLGVAYVPVAEQVGYEDKSFIVDFTGNVPESDVRLSQPRNTGLLIETIAKVYDLTQEAPVVETSEEAETIATDDYSLSIQEVKQNDYLGELERSMRTVAYCMDDLVTTSVELPLVLNDSPELKQLHEFATDDLPKDAAVVKVFDEERFAPAIQQFQNINNLKNSLSNETQAFEDVLKGLMHTIAGSVQALASLKVASVDKMVLDSNRQLLSILKAPYNHYSPKLEADEIERIRQERFDYSEDLQGYEPFSLRPSSRVRYSLADGTWVAEDGSVSAVPFGVHQIYEEIVAPVVQNLLAENRIERLKIYNHIKDQKLSYLTKWHQDTEEFYRANRAESADIINLMQESLRQYVAAYNTLLALKRTEDSMATSNDLGNAVVESVDNSEESLAAFELQSQEFEKAQNDFEEYMDRLKEDIDLKAERFGHVEHYDARLRDGYSNEVAVAAGEVADLEDRRRALAAVNPLFAKASELLPEPSVEPITFEHLELNLPVMALNALAALERPEDEPNPADIPPMPEEETSVEETVEEPAEAPAEEEVPPVPDVEEEPAEMPPVPPVEEEEKEDDAEDKEGEDDDQLPPPVN